MTQVRQAGQDDIPGIVRVHLEAFPGYFLTMLGPRFLARFYRGFVAEDAATLLVAETEQRVTGFLAGSSMPQEFFRRMRRRNGIQMAFVAIPSLLRHPHRVAERFLSAVAYRGDRPVDLHGYWLLSSLGVTPHKGGLGIGSALIQRYCDIAGASGGAGVYLLTDAAHNDRTLGFYRKCGFLEHSMLNRRDGRRLAVIARDLRNE